MTPGVVFTAPPTVGRFMKSDSFGRIIAGPVGSGKTTGCLFELLRRAIEQAPGDDGLRHTRFAIVRQTLKQLKDTVLRDIKQWIGHLGEYRVSESTFYVSFNDIRSEWLLIPMEDQEDQARLLSSQLTGCWMSECIEMDVSVIAPISGRCGRYPSAAHGVPSWMGIISDTNMPAELSPWWQFMEELPPSWQKFIQPSGMAHNAENLPHLPQTQETAKLPVDHPARIAQGRKYYERFIESYGPDSDWVKRYVYAQYGDDPSGTAVFRESFRTSFHVVDDTTPIPGYPLMIGQDFGRDPWSVIGQVDHLGRLLIHEEVPAENVGLETHVTVSLRARLFAEKYLGFKVAVVGDPAGVAKSQISEESNFDALRRMGLPAFPAPTNDLDPRLRAVESYFGRQVAGGPAIMISRKGCPTLVRALAGGYRFTKSKLTNTMKPKPDKGPFSHVVDALQYLCLASLGGGAEHIAARLRPKIKPKGLIRSAAGWT